jgi:hypothetical protein
MKEGPTLETSFQIRPTQRVKYCHKILETQENCFLPKMANISYEIRRQLSRKFLPQIPTPANVMAKQKTSSYCDPSRAHLHVVFPSSKAKKVTRMTETLGLGSDSAVCQWSLLCPTGQAVGVNTPLFPFKHTILKFQ